jgi:hypothetical protein
MGRGMKSRKKEGEIEGEQRGREVGARSRGREEREESGKKKCKRGGI